MGYNFPVIIGTQLVANVCYTYSKYGNEIIPSGLLYMLLYVVIVPAVVYVALKAPKMWIIALIMYWLAYIIVVYRTTKTYAPSEISLVVNDFDAIGIPENTPKTYIYTALTLYTIFSIATLLFGKTADHRRY